MKNGVLTLFSMWKLVVKSKSAQRPLGVSYDKKCQSIKFYDETLTEASAFFKAIFGKSG